MAPSQDEKKALSTWEARPGTTVKEMDGARANAKKALSTWEPRPGRAIKEKAPLWQREKSSEYLEGQP